MARAKGGKALSVDDIKVACRAHNVLEACRDFGDEVMLRYTRRGRRRARVTTATKNGDAAKPDTPAASIA
jgi:CMP-2-keto-3-deoxyoctulosonic acid synthetase